MTQSSGTLASFLVALVGVAINCAALPQESQDPRVQARSLAARGELAEAEKVARAGGSKALVALGDVLNLRGRLRSADSAYKAGSVSLSRAAASGVRCRVIPDS